MLDPDDLATDHRIVTWDYRGQGRSTAPSGPIAYSVAAIVSDLIAVQDALGVQRASHLGFGVGARVVLELHDKNSERLSSLILIQG
ncbi:MAG: alpha/beta fold hydrolase, partial [Actinobacteria bacterium]|nr:alpha/beta fold hydrolase [Actinomycetota bacterium]